MPHFLVNLYQTRGSFREVSSRGREWITTNWGMGSMIGLSPPASIFIGNPEVPTMVSIWATLGCAAGAAKYASQNWDKVRQFGPSTALALLAVTMILLHGADNWLSVFRWSPIFTSLTLLASVNVAPRLTRTLTALGAGFSAVIELGLRSRTEIAQEIDLEQAVGLLQMAELPNAGYQEPNDLDFFLGHMDHMDHFPDAEDPDLVEESPESVELDGDSVSTSPALRQLVEHCNQMPIQVSEETVISPIDPRPRQNMVFPTTPENHPLERQLARSNSTSRTEESSLAHMIPE